ncbi:hypothetical protein [Natrinema salifodinae]|uniref:Uncharacterized protein n=1 Tax=Natrinema salifodinae TaxID=1202768 RepID=A0A1I0M8Z9_9EURY|nr:hypothetical protein [Natrinema salifodinae]SEV84955.1 hypothetical protein SAMN05216285_0667 [Natrinema salifodinae]
MGIRTAVDQNPLLAFGLLFIAGWAVFVGSHIISVMGSITGGDWVGRHGLGGLMGLLVLAIFLGIVIAAFGALSEPEPAPNEWPPE